MQLSITKSAIRQINELVASKHQKDNILRVSVEGGGCSGFMYKYEFVDSILADDYVLEEDGAKVAVDQISQSYIDGCVLDFIEELGTAYFEIRNPNAVAKCGCGNSFAI